MTPPSMRASNTYQDPGPRLFTTIWPDLRKRPRASAFSSPVQVAAGRVRDFKTGP